ncbi:hypothetical protein M011DRAFT_71846 [Sporormia fimetaria CBS 119925]|uniref:Uncharacterized protein n=1 Tax=Sporormia fimetaria CBS 119925 TaxID=1340428 RepID=A0A6A6V8H2_9PLEO|nr:hypothetical protein M011DRAFT_71846 [Sporormia fimetaria CBS 119925]
MVCCSDSTAHEQKAVERLGSESNYCNPAVACFRSVVPLHAHLRHGSCSTEEQKAPRSSDWIHHSRSTPQACPAERWHGNTPPRIDSRDVCHQLIHAGLHSLSSLYHSPTTVMHSPRPDITVSGRLTRGPRCSTVCATQAASSLTPPLPSC